MAFCQRFLSGLLILMAACALEEPASNAPVLEAAKAQLQHLIDGIPRGLEQGYGFAGHGELARAEPGRLFQLHAMDLVREPAFVAEDVWRVALTVDGQPRALVTVARADGKWRAVELGAAVLARELDAVVRSQASHRGPFGLLRVYGLGCDLVTPTLERPQTTWSIIPLRSAMQELGVDATPMTYATAVKMLTKRLRDVPTLP